MIKINVDFVLNTGLWTRAEVSLWGFSNTFIIIINFSLKKKYFHRNVGDRLQSPEDHNPYSIVANGNTNYILNFRYSGGWIKVY
jgi:hypothetical protein